MCVFLSVWQALTNRSTEKRHIASSCIEMTNNGPFHLQPDRFKTLVYYSFFWRPAHQRAAGLFKEAPGKDGGAEWQVEANACRGFCRPFSSRLHYANSNMACYSVLNIYRASFGFMTSGPHFQCRLKSWLFWYKSTIQVDTVYCNFIVIPLYFVVHHNALFKSKHAVTGSTHVITRADKQCVYPSWSTFARGDVTPMH